MIKKRKSKRSKRIKPSMIVMITIMIINIIAPSTAVYAGNASKVPKFFGDRSEVWVSEGSNDPIMSQITDTCSMPSASSLYGETVSYPHYRGEVSDKSADDYYYCKKKIMKINRSFYDSDKDEDDVDSDIRVHCLQNQLGLIDGFFRPLGSGLGNFMRSCQIGIFGFLIEIKDFDLLDILDIFLQLGSGGKTLTQQIREVLVMSEDGTLSPFMMIFLILWIVGMAGAVIKWLSGNGGTELVKRELLYLLLGLFLFGLSLVADAPTRISQFGVAAANTINEMVSNNQENNIFKCSYTDSHKETVQAQRALFVKANIDSSLCSIYGCDSVSDLDVGAGKLSVPKDNYTEKIVVSNGTYGVSNIGYMLWAGQSHVNPNAPYKDGKVKYISGGNINSIHWFIPDILEASGGVDNETMVKYADRLNKRETFFYFGDSFMFCLEAFFFVIAEVFCVYVVMIGKVVLTISGLFIFALPGLFLWEKSRRFAIDICRTYIGAFVRVAIGNVLFITFLLMFSILTSNNNIISMMIGVLLFGLIMIMMPTKIIPAINQMLMEIEGYGAIASKYRQLSEKPLDAINRKNADYKAQIKAKREARKNRKKYDKDRKDEERDFKDQFRELQRLNSDTDHEDRLEIREDITNHGMDPHAGPMPIMGGGSGAGPAGAPEETPIVSTSSGDYDRGTSTGETPIAGSGTGGSGTGERASGGAYANGGSGEAGAHESWEDTGGTGTTPMGSNVDSNSDSRRESWEDPTPAQPQAASGTPQSPRPAPPTNNNQNGQGTGGEQPLIQFTPPAQGTPQGRPQQAPQPQGRPTQNAAQPMPQQRRQSEYSGGGTGSGQSSSSYDVAAAAASRGRAPTSSGQQAPRPVSRPSSYRESGGGSGTPTSNMQRVTRPSSYSGTSGGSGESEPRQIKFDISRNQDHVDD